MSYCFAIVGRANVGKSSLFNALCRKRVAIVDPSPGVTRDRIAREIPVSGGRSIELVDTGGVGMESNEELVNDVDMQIEIAITRADTIVFVVDAGAGLHPLDGEIARRLRAAAKDVLLVANKAENTGSRQNVMEFHELGLGEPFAVSASHNVGLDSLRQELLSRLEGGAAERDRQSSGAVKLALVGQRNVGKSTLINYLAGEHRVVVSEVPGTTRDSVDVRFDYWDGGQALRFLAIDTAGVRRKKQLRQSVDYYSQVRTHKAIQRADVVVHILDAHRKIARVDKQWGEEIVNRNKPAVLAVNKMDLVDADVEKPFIDYIWEHLRGMRFAPIVFTSARTGENVFPLLELAYTLYREAGVRVKTSELNEVVNVITSRKPPPSRTSKRGKILFATQVDVRPPSIALFVNDAADITASYRRYIEGELREALPYSHIPIKLMIRRRRGESRG